MKLLRWSLAGASAFVIYKYSIGKKAKGDDVFQSPERTLANAKTDTNVRAAKAASHEQRVALGLGALLLVVATSAWHRSHPKFAEAEADHAS